MQKMISANPVHSVEFLTLNGKTELFDPGYSFIYLLSGSIRIQNEHETQILEKNDVFLIYPLKKYTISGNGDTMLLRVIFTREAIESGTGTWPKVIVCNSVTDRQRDYKNIRSLLTMISNSYFSEETYAETMLTSLSYQFIYYLCTYHIENTFTPDFCSENMFFSERNNELNTYISLHYMEQLSLQKLATEIHLSPAYLSRLFHKQFGMTFSNYLNKVRFEHFVQDLVYTKLPIAEIAEANGFTNVSMLHRVFQETYHMTPSKYRNNYLQDKPDLSKENGALQPAKKEQMALFLNNKKGQVNNQSFNLAFPASQEVIVDFSNDKKTVCPPDRYMINLGYPEHLNYAAVHDQLRTAQSEIGFYYGRIEGIFDEKFLPWDEKKKSFLFNSFDMDISMILSNHMKPYLEIGYSYKENVCELKPGSHGYRYCYLEQVTNFLHHCIVVYGIGEVSSWIFEISIFQNYRTGTYENINDFVQRFSDTLKIFRLILPQAKVGGINLCTIFSSDLLKDILIKLKTKGECPDFISIQINPYLFSENQENNEAKSTLRKFYTSDQDFVYKEVRTRRKVMRESGFSETPVFISQMSSDMACRQYMNDSCFQAAFLAKSVTDIIDEVDIIGFYQLSDCSYMHLTGDFFLRGFNGIMSRNGIRKPSYFAIEFFRHMGNRLVSKGEDYLVTKKGKDVYTILLFNYIHINSFYREHVQEEIPPEKSEIIYKTPNTKTIFLLLDGMSNGNYKIATRRVNKEHGSIMDVWIANDHGDSLASDELQYFMDTVKPVRNWRKQVCTAHKIKLQIQLRPFEVVFIELSLEYE